MNVDVKKRISALRVANSSRVVSVLNDLLIKDPVACRTLLQFKTYCDPSLIDHPLIEVSSHHKDTVAQIGLIGVLNGILQALDIPRAASVYVEDVLVGFQIVESDIRIAEENTSSELGEHRENNNEPKDSSEELPFHDDTSGEFEEVGAEAEIERCEDNGNGDSGEGSGDGISEDGEASAEHGYQEPGDLDTYKVEPLILKPVQEV